MPVPQVTITNGNTVSGSINLNQQTLTGLFIDSVLTGTKLTFQTSLDGSAFFNIQDGTGAAYSVIVASPPCFVPVDVNKFRGVSYLTVSSNVNQNGNSIITLSTGVVT